MEKQADTPSSLLKEDKLVEVLRPATEGVGHVVLKGYLGKAERSGHWRIYLDASFTEYIEVAEPGILHREADASNDALGGSIIWISRGTSVTHVRTRQTIIGQTSAESDPFDIVIRKSGRGTNNIAHPFAATPPPSASCWSTCGSCVTCYSSCPDTSCFCDDGGGGGGGGGGRSPTAGVHCSALTIVLTDALSSAQVASNVPDRAERLLAELRMMLEKKRP